VKTFPACWRTKKQPLAHEGDPKTVDDRRTSSDSSRSATSSSVDSQSSSELLSPKGISSTSDASPLDTSTRGASSVSPLQMKTEPASCATENESTKPSTCAGVSESKTSNSASTSTRKMNLSDYRSHRTKHSVTTLDHNSNTSVASKQKDIHRSEKESTQSESTVEIANSASKASGTNKSDAKPRLKLKIGSEVVVKTSFSPRNQSCVVRKSDEIKNVVHNGSSLSEQHSSDNVPNTCVSEKLNLPNGNASMERSGDVFSNNSSCEEESSDSEPPPKRRMSLNHPLSSVVDTSACRWVHHD